MVLMSEARAICPQVWSHQDNFWVWRWRRQSKMPDILWHGEPKQVAALYNSDMGSHLSRVLILQRHQHLQFASTRHLIGILLPNLSQHNSLIWFLKTIDYSWFFCLGLVGIYLDIDDIRYKDYALPKQIDQRSDLVLSLHVMTLCSRRYLGNAGVSLVGILSPWKITLSVMQLVRCNICWVEHVSM